MTCILGTNIKQVTLVMNIIFYESCVNVPAQWEQYVQRSPSILTCVQIARMNIGQHLQDWVVLPYAVRCHGLVSFSALCLGTPSSESSPIDLQLFFFSVYPKKLKIIYFKNMPITVYFYIPQNLSLTAFIHHLIIYKLHSWKTHKSVFRNLDYFLLQEVE
jgi:hypothetical protein